MSFLNLFSRAKPIIGMVHLAALPGTPRAELRPNAIIARAVAETELLRAAGVDGLIIENMGDIPYLKGGVGPEVTALMTVAAREVKAASGLPCGVQVLAGANREALAVALAAGLEFIRAEGFVYAHVADEGLIEADAGALLRFRRSIGAASIAVLCDIKKKHAAHAITGDVSISEVARGAQFCLADGVIVTGVATGCEADINELQAVRAAVTCPVLAGSGVTIKNLAAQLAVADAVIVGSHFKLGGLWSAALDLDRLQAFMAAAHLLRNRTG